MLELVRLGLNRMDDETVYARDIRAFLEGGGQLDPTLSLCPTPWADPVSGLDDRLGRSGSEDQERPHDADGEQPPQQAEQGEGCQRQSDNE